MNSLKMDICEACVFVEATSYCICLLAGVGHDRFDGLRASQGPSQGLSQGHRRGLSQKHRGVHGFNKSDRKALSSGLSMDLCVVQFYRTTYVCATLASKRRMWRWQNKRFRVFAFRGSQPLCGRTVRRTNLHPLCKRNKRIRSYRADTRFDE